MSKVMVINEDYFKEILEHTSKSLVGKVLKRFEILQDKDAVKASTKELIYEEFRNLRNLLLAHNEGVNTSLTKFEFKQPKGKLTP